MKKQLLIIQCPDQLRWYSCLIGELVPFFGDTGIEYRSQQPDGYINFVQYEDAKIVATPCSRSKT